MVPFPNEVRQTREQTGEKGRGGCFLLLENHQGVCQLLAHAGPVLPVRLRDVTSQMWHMELGLKLSLFWAKG